MRARSALVVVSLLFGAAAIPAEASTADRQPRPGASRQQARPAAARPPQRPTIRHTAIPPQEQALAARATPAMAWGQLATGTPVLPVSVTSGLSCVPFARMATGLNISGDARLWWNNAAGAYARGQLPERGSVLAFMASGGMSRGHVAVVSRILNARTILVDHANWAGPGIQRGTVMRGVAVVDVSDRNDWTSVRVQFGHSDEAFGRTYPTYGFIYNRPVGERILTASGFPVEEVAFASPHARLHMRLAAETLAE
jgi:surface antigen